MRFSHRSPMLDGGTNDARRSRSNDIDDGPLRRDRPDQETPPIPTIQSATEHSWDSSSGGVCVLMASHNRVERTLLSLESLGSQDVDVPLTAVLLDDGSVDRTSTEVKSHFPWVLVIQGDGSLFWAASMARAEAIAHSLNPSYFMWLNDDVELAPNALNDLLALSQQKSNECIVIGQTVDPRDGGVTYGGSVRAGWHPLRFTGVSSTATRRIDVFNGNIVLVPERVARRIGGIDGSYAHAYADNDYALRARSLGVEIWQLGQPIGTCELNLIRSDIFNPSVPVRRRIALAADRKGLPPASQFRYYRRHAGTFWLPLVVASYLRILFPRRSNRTVQ